MSSKEQHDTKLLDLARQYEARGYTVQVEPAREAVPFDLGGYRPDLLAEKGSEHLLVELKTGGPLPINYLQQVVETVRQHSGWRFILVNDANPSLGLDTRLLPAAVVEEKANRAGVLLENGDVEAAFLLLWTVLEALLRQHAEAIGLPLQQQQPRTLINYLYSEGDLGMPQYDVLMAALPARNQLAHGYEVPNLPPLARDLHRTLRELLDEWVSTPTVG